MADEEDPPPPPEDGEAPPPDNEPSVAAEPQAEAEGQPPEPVAEEVPKVAPPPENVAKVEPAPPEDSENGPPVSAGAPPSDESPTGSAGAKRRSSKKISFGDDEQEPEESSGEDEEFENESEEGDEEETQVTKKKSNKSVSDHHQSDLNNQRLAAAKLAREERRALLDLQHQYFFTIVAANLELKPKDVEEFVLDSAQYIQCIDKFIQKKGTKAIFFVYQESDPPGEDTGRPIQPKQKDRMLRVAVSDGSDVPLRGKVIYFIRPSNAKKVTINSIAADTYFGLLDIADPDEPGIVLDAVIFNLNTLLIPYLQNVGSWVTISDPELAESVRYKFLTSIQHYSEFLSDCKHDITSRLDLSKIADMNDLIEKHLSTPEKVVESAKNPEVVTAVEHIVILWCKNIERVLALSKLMRKDTDIMGPNAELAYWRNLHAKMCFIIQQIQQWQFVHFIQLLIHSKSKVLRRWRDVDARVTDDYHESKDNVRYMYALSKFVEPLYQLDPQGMVQYISSMMYTIQTIHTTSRYYNSCEKVTALLVKISNQMVYACRRYLTSDGTETIWGQEKRTMIEKLKKCLELYATYRGSYEETKANLQENPEGKQFNFSVNHIFGRYDLFCERLRKIITLLEIFDMYKFVHESHIDGIEVISLRLNNLFRNILKKAYDPLEFRQSDFDKDFITIRSSLDEIQKALEAFMDKAIDNCSTAMHCLTLLERFANLRNRCLNIEEKQWYAFQFYHNEINMLKGVYESEKNETPIPRGYPPFAGKIAWARHLFRRLERPMLYFQEKTKVLEREDSRPTVQAYNGLAKKLIYFEILFHDAWVKQSSAIYDSLEAPLLTLRGNIRQEMVLNFDPFFRQIIDETEIIRKLDLEIPDVAQIVYYRQDKIFATYEKMKGLLDKFVNVKSKIPIDLTVLIRALLKRVEKSFMPGVTNINWTSFKCDEYFDFIQVHLDELEAIANKIDDILSVRVNQCLYDICHTMMIDLPEDKPMVVQEYMRRILEYGKIVAKDLEYKSRHCEAAVIELINTLVATNELNVPDQILYSWMNPNIFGKEDKKAESESKASVVVTSRGRKKTQKAGRSDNMALVEMVNELSQTVRDEVSHLHEECRHVFMFYSQKCIEALQKTTRTSLDMLRRRTEEPQLNKRNPGKIENRIPLFTSDLILTIPLISLKPPIEETQKVLSRSVTTIVECLKQVVIWGQSRRTSFDASTDESYFKDALKATASAEAAKAEGKVQSQDAYEASFQPENLNAKLKNCYKPVMDYKDISKMVVIMQTVVTQEKPKILAIVHKYMAYSYLWRKDRDDEIRAFVAESPAITEVAAVMKRYNDLITEIGDITLKHRIGPLEIITTELKSGLTVEVESWKHALCKFLADDYRRKTADIAKFVEDINKDLALEIKDLADIKFAMVALGKVRDRFVDDEALLTPIEECYAFLAHQGFEVPEEELARAENLRLGFNKLQAKTLTVQDKICALEEDNRRKLIEAISRFQGDLKRHLEKYREGGPMIEGLTPQEASDRLNMFQREFDAIHNRYMLCNEGEKLFGFIPREYPEMNKHMKELALLQKLYGLYNDVMRSISGYSQIKWVDLDIQQIMAELAEFQTRCRRLPKALKDWPAFIVLKKKIDDFNETCPLLELMADKSMKPRHWERIGEVTGYKFDLDNENFCLKDVLGCPLLKFKDEVEDICIGAGKEKDIEAKMKQIVLDWSTITLQFTSFKNRGEMLLKGQETADVMTLLEDALMILNFLFNNRYSSLYRKDLQAHLTDFSNTAQILENWLAVQNLWIYLEAVFVGGDIARQMPLEAKRFQDIDRTWVKIMNRARENPLVIECCVGDETMGQLLPYLLEQLELCQKSLSGYLESKRKIFPRFFFVSDPVLLEILGQASDCHTIQPHLLSIFENVNEIDWHPKEYSRMLGVISKEGEKVMFEEPGVAEGNVEEWLGVCLHQQQQSLLGVIRDSAYALNATDFELLEFLATYLAQVGLLGIQILWTRDAENALMSAKRDRRIMQQTNAKFLGILNVLISQTTKNLTKYERIKFETLITIHVHQRDIFDDICKARVKSPYDFEWLKQARFFFSFEQDSCIVRITNITFRYCNEFLGCTDRLVITPLTDRCYITIAQAAGNSLGANPSGPAGTGKTETSKDMAKALGKYCVVFNCSDQMDFRGLGRIFKGMAQSGSWGCFDEINRIELPVLSVAAQQIHIILQARREAKDQFIFSDGDLVDMNPEFAVIVTMNPGYAGRVELPENMKVQFRAISMIVPDKQIIIRVKLASCGFLENVVLARKFYTLYRLCEEQLSKQVHYDFGLRNILAVLRTLGFQKRKRVNDAEETVIMAVLRDMNLSKLVDEDEGLFLSLIKDLFPGVQLESVTHDDLQKAIADEVQQAKLINHPSWNLKVIQFYETSLVRHGLMALGPTSAGKTQMMLILMRSITQLGIPHKEVRMNPKAILAYQMFGRLDVATNDWTDGIFSTIWRKALKVKKSEALWIVLDGPVDAVWIENLNSVLDDNKTLTLANGDRIVMGVNVKLVFEPDNVDNASPATVSRVGMVFMSASVLPWQPILQSWLLKRSKHENDVLYPLFEKIFSDLLFFIKINTAPKMAVQDALYIRQAIDLLQGVIQEAMTFTSAANQKSNISHAHYERLFLFSLMWSVGALLELKDRAKMQEFVTTHESNFDWPKHTAEETIFEFAVGATGQWEHWKHHVEEYVYPPDSIPQYANILVPNVDNIRTNYLIHQIAKEGKAVLLIGEQGTAKTVMINKYLESYNPETQMSKIINFSSETTPNLYQRTVESFVDKRMGTTYGPPRGRKLTIFIDDINMPVFNDWGDQITNEIVRQLMEMKGIYSLDKPGEFNYILDIQFMAAMIHPGGGRNDIPHRLKRQFCIFNCTLPSDSSMDKIFDVIGMGYFCHTRFSDEIVGAIPSIVPLTRTLWQRTKLKMLPTPAKFHYVFNLRDLSRIWEGLLRVVNMDCSDIRTLLSLWKHECTRVIADRFINEEDTNWFLKQLHTVVTEQLGDSYEQVLPTEPLWVSFMLDPDDMIEQGRLNEEDDLPEFPFVYQPIPSFDGVKQRLANFEEQFNEIARGAKLDLVYFRDAVLHILRISRIIRTDRGCAMLVGVGGSGKQSLTKLASFLSGYTTFQITLTRAYGVSNLLEDLKGLYKQAGQKGKGVSFIFTDNDIKEEGFLEYFNNMLSSGEIANLLAKDEVDEICNELIMPMKKEFGKREPTMDNLYSYFISRVRKNLHLVLCFSPVGPKFRSRSLKFPGLVSGCTIDWFSKWPRDALVAVSRHFITNFPIVCPGDTKNQLIDLMATIHDQVSAVCIEYFGRFRRQTHVTPKSYLSFIHGYKQIYRDSRKHYEMLSKRMDTGLVKLQEAAVQVAALSKELEVMEAHLAIASAEAEKVLESVTIVATSAQKVKDEVKIVKDAAEELVKVIKVEKMKAEGQLELARPALLEAEEALKTINQADIATVRKLGKPPHLIQRVLDMVLILFYKKLDPYVMDMAADSSDPKIGNCPKPSWQLALRFMSTNFLNGLINFPLDSINGEHKDLMEPMFRMKDYTGEKAKQVCGNVAGLLLWTKALATYYGVNKNVLPLKMNLAQSEGKLAKANKKLDKAQEILGVKEVELGAATKLYEAQMSKRQIVVDEANRCKRKMTLASDLINGLGGERERWTEQSKTFKSSIIRLTGDVVLLTGFLSYTGPFNQEYRSFLLDTWKGELKRRRIPTSMDISVINMLVEPHIVGEWNLHGLPNDELSIQNGIIVNRGPRYPLLIDPQVQGKAWLKSLEKVNNLKITSQNHKYFRQHVEESLSQGLPLLVEDIAEELDPLLDNVLEKNFIKAGNFLKVKLGDSEIEVVPGFRLYMTTKLPNPVYSPEISARTLIIDFTVTMKGLEDQLLGRVIGTEKEELEADRVALVEAVTANRRKMAELEENLLYKLSSIQGSLLDDESIVEVLNTTKTTALDVKEKLFVAAETEKKINIAREEFRPVATRGSILYFLICDMVMVNCMYQTSLNQFLELFDSSMSKSEKTTVVSKRIQFIIEYLTYEIFRYSSRGFYEQHKFMFTLLMALKVDINRGTVKFNEFQTLIKGGGALDLNAVAPKPYPWMTDVTWLNLVELSKLPRFQNIQAQVTKNDRFWKAWFDKDAPEDEKVPDGYDNIDSFNRLLLIRSWCPDRVMSQAKKYVGTSLGPKFASPVVLSLEELHTECRPNAPCCCFLSMGSDPTPQIESLAKRLHIPIKSISMGQGQEIHARALLSNFMAEGGWVLLQNCHLGLEFMTELLYIILDYENPHASFRLWLTTEVHVQFPISLLQICIKFTNDPPQGVKAGLKRTYTSITSDTLEYTNATQWRPMLYAISFMHSVVQERRKYGALGWNIPYEFNWADWAACVQFFQTHLDEIDPKKGVSWVTIRYMVGEVHYGGRVTDEYDKRLLGTFSRVWLSDAILAEGFQFSEGYGILKLKTVEDYVRIIDELLPNNEQPGIYGLHRNAGITLNSNTAKNMLDTILEIQPKDSATGGGETREAIVYRQAAEFLEKLPPNFVPHRIKEKITEMGGLTPMNITLRQEIDRMQRVLKVVRQTLTDLKLAIDGTIIMNEALRDALDSIFDAKVPIAWKKVSWQSTTIGFWFTELLERNAQLVKWLNKGRPSAFWMTGFFNPQGFLTAMKQEVTRAHKGWALDQVALHNEVLKMTKEELGNSSPPEGVYVYGLFIEGAAWEKAQCKIVESAPKILFGQMPVIHIVASDNIKPKDSSLYECPVYKKPGRTGLNFICPLWLRSDYPPEHWILRGVALLCDVK